MSHCLLFMSPYHFVYDTNYHKQARRHGGGGGGGGGMTMIIPLPHYENKSKQMCRTLSDIFRAGAKSLGAIAQSSETFCPPPPPKKKKRRVKHPGAAPEYKHIYTFSDMNTILFCEL